MNLFIRFIYMAKINNIQGFDKVIRNLNSEIAKIEGRSTKGLIEAGIFVRRETETTPPLTPLDTGNLRSSWATSTFRTPAGPSHNIGYTANYAAYVHENVDAQFSGREPVKRKGKKSLAPGGRPGSGAKWFQAALGRNHKKILSIIQASASIKK